MSWQNKIVARELTAIIIIQNARQRKRSAEKNQIIAMHAEIQIKF